MTRDPLDWCLGISAAHASLNLKFDDELGTLHGLGLADFVLLRLLARAPDGRIPMTALVRPLGVRLSEVARRLIVLEKTGLAQREAAPGGGTRHAAIRPGGRALLNAALVTAQAVCADALRPFDAATLAAADDVLQALSRSEALAL